MDNFLLRLLYKKIKNNDFFYYALHIYGIMESFLQNINKKIMDNFLLYQCQYI